MTVNIYIRKIPLPINVKAFTIPDEQGDYNIYINSNLSLEQQYKSLTHEQNHILNDDFIKETSAEKIENEARSRENHKSYAEY